AVHAQSANDALRALKGLGAAVTVGVNLEEYRRRLIDAKVIVDDYAQRKAVSLAEAKAKHALVTAMGDFNLANAIWAGRVQRGGSGVGLRTFDMLKERLKDVECAPLKTLVDAVLKDYEQDEGQTRLSIVVYGPASD